MQVFSLALMMRGDGVTDSLLMGTDLSIDWSMT